MSNADDNGDQEAMRNDAISNAIAIDDDEMRTKLRVIVPGEVIMAQDNNDCNDAEEDGALEYEQECSHNEAEFETLDPNLVEHVATTVVDVNDDDDDDAGKAVAISQTGASPSNNDNVESTTDNDGEQHETIVDTACCAIDN